MNSLDQITRVTRLIANDSSISESTKQVLYQFVGSVEVPGIHTKGPCYASNFADINDHRTDTDTYRMKTLGFRTFLTGRARR